VAGNRLGLEAGKGRLAEGRPAGEALGKARFVAAAVADLEGRAPVAAAAAVGEACSTAGETEVSERVLTHWRAAAAAGVVLLLSVYAAITHPPASIESGRDQTHCTGIQLLLPAPWLLLQIRWVPGWVSAVCWGLPLVAVKK
jgi:hypothetical protein